MLIYKTKLFSKWSMKEGVSDEVLKDAVNEMNQGLIDILVGMFAKSALVFRVRGKEGAQEP